MRAVPKGVGIWGLGIALPSEVRTNAWWPESIVTEWRAKRGESPMRPEESSGLYDSLGNQRILQGMARCQDDPFRGSIERRILPEPRPYSELEAEAGREAISNAGLEPGQIDALLVYSLVPDYLTVPNAPLVHRLLGLREDCFVSATDTVCSAFLTQLSLAEGLICAGRARYVLIVQSNGMSRLVRRQDPHSAWFGDAASAAVVGEVSEGRGLLGVSHKADGRLHDSMVTGCEGMPWYKGSKIEFFVYNREACREMLMRLADMGRDVVHAALDQAGATPEEVQFYACHQSSPWLREVTQAHSGLVNARFVDTFAWTGNIVASHVPLMFAIAEKEKLLSPGDLVATYTGGSGITWSGLALRWGR